MHVIAVIASATLKHIHNYTQCVVDRHHCFYVYLSGVAGLIDRSKRSVRDPLLALDVLESIADDIRSQVFAQQTV